MVCLFNLGFVFNVVDFYYNVVFEMGCVYYFEYFYDDDYCEFVVFFGVLVFSKDDYSLGCVNWGFVEDLCVKMVVIYEFEVCID